MGLRHATTHIRVVAVVVAAVVGVGVDDARAQVEDDDGRLQAGDVVRVHLGQDEPVTDCSVGLDGAIDLGRFGVVRVAGLDPERALERVRERLARSRRDVTGVGLLRVRRGVLVNVTGLVQKPGAVSMPLSQRDVWTALMAAGGVADGGDLAHVRVLRDGALVGVVDVATWLERGGGDELSLDAGDVVMVPALHSFGAVDDARPIWEPSRGELATRLRPGVNVLGGVQRPGRVTLTSPLPLLDVLALAGGPSVTGDLHRVSIVRGAPGLTATSVIDVAAHAGAGLDRIMVQPGDTVLVANTDDDPIRVAVGVISNIAVVAGVVGVLVGLVGATQ